MQFVDLHKYHQSIRQEIDAVIKDIISESAFIGSNGNRFVKEFEHKFSEFIGVSNCVACANGTDAIEIALVALGIGAGDEVLVPALSWYSTAEAVASIGAIPVFVDINIEDGNIDPAKIEALITDNTKAIIPVHLYGNPADMDKLMNIAQKHNLLIIEDCAQAHGAMIGDQVVGSFGDASTFSFYPGKNLGAFGDAGAMLFKNAEIAKIARQIRNHGQEEKHTHIRLGCNSRMDGLHAGILSLKLDGLNEQTEKRIKVAKRYNELLHPSIVKPVFQNGVKSVFHLYVIQVNDREGLITKFKSKGIPFGIHYPKALPHLAPFNIEGGYEVANTVCDRIISLPIHPFLLDEEIKQVANEVNLHQSSQEG